MYFFILILCLNTIASMINTNPFFDFYLRKIANVGPASSIEGGRIEGFGTKIGGAAGGTTKGTGTNQTTAGKKGGTFYFGRSRKRGHIGGGGGGRRRRWRRRRRRRRKRVPRPQPATAATGRGLDAKHGNIDEIWLHEHVLDVFQFLEHDPGHARHRCLGDDPGRQKRQWWSHGHDFTGR